MSWDYGDAMFRLRASEQGHIELEMDADHDCTCGWSFDSTDVSSWSPYDEWVEHVTWAVYGGLKWGLSEPSA